MLKLARTAFILIQKLATLELILPKKKFSDDLNLRKAWIKPGKEFFCKYECKREMKKLYDCRTLFYVALFVYKLQSTTYCVVTSHEMSLYPFS